MKILFLEWKSIGNQYIHDAVDSLKKAGKDLDICDFPYDNHIELGNIEYEESLRDKLREYRPDFVMSFNFWPVISKVCNSEGVKYISWVYDNPAINLFSYTLINPCNYVFIFDSHLYEMFACQGIKTVYYLPMAAAVKQYDEMVVTDSLRLKWGGEIAFVGGLYTEGHNYYDDIIDKISDYSRGYLEGLMNAQMEVHGLNFIEQLIPDRVLQEMVDVLGAKPGSDSVESYEYIYANYVLNRKISAMERTQIMEMIGKKYCVNLFTRDSTYSVQGVKNRGKVDYYDEMPYVFKCTDINLNITLRSIQTGIPLRAFDIMGCEGFLLTNFQSDMLRFFVPGEDYVYYESRADLMDKIDYYLEHEEERKRIAQNGYIKVKSDHTYEHRLQMILDIVSQNG